MKVVLITLAVVPLFTQKISAEKRHFTCGKKIHLFILYHLQLCCLFVTVPFFRPKNCKVLKSHWDWWKNKDKLPIKIAIFLPQKSRALYTGDFCRCFCGSLPFCIFVDISVILFLCLLFFWFFVFVINWQSHATKILFFVLNSIQVLLAMEVHKNTKPCNLPSISPML